ncbi:MAG: ATP-binding cassette domain-containing protein [Planctomycetota bacterium]|nr:ATP-binding cassette domain-containing protein [Planctomycetota bacterium]
MTVVELRGVRVHYPGQTQPALNIDALSIGEGERVAFIGPSGCGKTTLLRLVNGYLEAQSGELRVLDTLNKDVSRRRRRGRAFRTRVGFVFQSFNLVERATVFDNVLWGRLGRVHPWRSLFGGFSPTDKEIAMQAIEEVDLIDQLGQRADTLSGGQQQRVGVARVLAQEAEIVLADEPVSSLDPALADDVLGLLAEVSTNHEVTLLMSLHQPELAARHANRVVGLRHGRVVWQGAAAELDAAAIETIYDRAA